MKLLICLVVALVATPVAAETLSGKPSVIDGDTLEVAGKRVRLFGIDAPEATQTCTRNGETWACGQASADRLGGLIGTATLTCVGAEFDIYGRLLAVCSIDGTDLNRTMVANGWAVAFRRYSDRYVADETRARAGKLGLWSSDFEPPQEYRAEERATGNARARALPRRVAARPAATGCRIKGNRNRRGEWIYHLPGMPYYEQTRAEEMFCTEAEAQAAGYRKSKARW
jgi:endonuclease YncB( thermonuclease family)